MRGWLAHTGEGPLSALLTFEITAARDEFPAICLEGVRRVTVAPQYPKESSAAAVRRYTQNTRMLPCGSKTIGHAFDIDGHALPASSHRRSRGPVPIRVFRVYRLYHGRDARHRTPPAQIPAGGIPAPGSHLGCLTAKRLLSQGWVMHGLGSRRSRNTVIRCHVTLPFCPRQFTTRRQRLVTLKSMSRSISLSGLASSRAVEPMMYSDIAPRALMA